MEHKMPKDFFWGNSVSSMQTEGAWNEGGKSKSVYDVRPATENSMDWNITIDEYHRYEEDFDLMKEMNMNMYRFQISWSRVVVDGDGEFNEEGIEFYSKQIDALLARGIEPMICLYHFDMPLALAEKYNGFLDRHVVDAFVRYSNEMVKRFGDRVKYWITFNEHNLYFMDLAYNIAGAEKAEKSLDNLYQIFHHTMLAHAHVANNIHENYPDLQIGGMLAYAETYPATSKPVDILAARKVDEFLNYNLLDAFVHGRYSHEVLTFVKNEGINMDYLPEDDEVLGKMTSDWLSFSYYRTDTVNADLIPAGTAPNHYLDFANEHNRFLESNEWNWTIDPLGLRDIISKMYSRYGVPVFPIENGIGWREEWDGKNEIQDDIRIKYHRDHIQAMKDAMFIDGAQVIGYLGWGLIDIPSSSGNMDKRYGMVYVNRTNADVMDLKRVPKKSFHWFKEVLADNGDDLH
ncbi:glycoside hydrolase family 1 protein [Periweissella cryptocerci]|uniref:Glycoside hydrolase family 1 protein n=1 Tax=Periweissella cryptocerci TaxID=2506420 RepID=A0A4P6YUV0_9LACO|nr:glycoside hydrolase family 1 protein [Periweissella cryptocerci]QBO36477.1 glycoside hydrolase family 1 protein [Periweissella cryptocerci]